MDNPARQIYLHVALQQWQISRMLLDESCDCVLFHRHAHTTHTNRETNTTPQILRSAVDERAASASFSPSSSLVQSFFKRNTSHLPPPHPRNLSLGQLLPQLSPGTTPLPDAAAPDPAAELSLQQHAPAAVSALPSGWTYEACLLCRGAPVCLAGHQQLPQALKHGCCERLGEDIRLLFRSWNPLQLHRTTLHSLGDEVILHIDVLGSV